MSDFISIIDYLLYHSTKVTRNAVFENFVYHSGGKVPILYILSNLSGYGLGQTVGSREVW